MSKIHLALEKAEKERAEELMKKTVLAPVREEIAQTDPGPAVPVVRFDSLKADESLVALYQPRSDFRSSSANCGRSSCGLTWPGR